MALINVASPVAPITGIPGLTDAAAQTTADALDRRRSTG